MNWLVTLSPRYKRPAIYLDWIARSGIVGVAHPTDTPACPSPDGFDALLLSGGGDVEPARYGAVPAPETTGIDPARDRREVTLIQAFIAAGKPVFGICRGIQIVNVALGGGLIQHVPHYLGDTRAALERHSGPDEQDATHVLRVAPGSPLGAALGVIEATNSMHHQAVDPARPAAGLHPIAWSGQGIIEAATGLFNGVAVEAVQWHPERLPPEHPAAARLLAHWHAQTRARGGL